MDLGIFRLHLNMFLRCFFCTLMFENHCWWLSQIMDCQENVWCLYFPQYSHTSTKICNTVVPYIAVMFLEIRFRILFMTKNWVEGTTFISGSTSQENLWLFVLISNIYLISLRAGITGPLTKLRWFQDGLETSPEYILIVYWNHCPKNNANRLKHLVQTEERDWTQID